MLTVKSSTKISPSVSLAVGLPAVSHAALLCIDPDGSAFTVLGTDLEFQAFLEKATALGFQHLTVEPARFPLCRAGWPDDWTASTPSVPTSLVGGHHD
ncbi:hypothetical protein GCM10022198_00450 [Klugiella xanthotipulae]|uniref:Uncharacterized protein n=1 Tax=Klugiella xanthotipulae TaxID=244735 RepID=A0A543I5D0_9MICO|nr:hypothetical protein [Klugiella xanthotipulae]TQM65816.1 hypothetical protein FB466_0629 [Klugiella xanthotipulae]